MTEVSVRAPMFKMLAVFVGTLIAANLAVIALEYFAPDLAMPSSIGVILVMAAAMASGQVAAQVVKRRLTLGEKATFALVATLASFLVVFAVIGGALAYVGLPLTEENVVLGMTGEMVPQSEIAEMLPLVGLLMAAISLLVCFFSVGWGARTQVKALERQAAKAN